MFLQYLNQAKFVGTKALPLSESAWLKGTVRVWYGDGDREGRDGVNPSTTHLHDLYEKMCRRGACPHRREPKGTFCDGATGDRKGRDGVNPSTTHLRVASGEMCRRGACPLATLAVAVSGIIPLAPLSSRLWGLPPRDPRGRR
jgi:hypothetical protein